MNISDFTLPEPEQRFLKEVDTLVEEGLPRPVAERIAKQICDIIDGPWNDLLGLMSTEHVAKGSKEEAALIQTFWVAYAYQWASERLDVAGAVQASILAKYALGLEGTDDE